jgi:hypothetical protein
MTCYHVWMVKKKKRFTIGIQKYFPVSLFLQNPYSLKKYLHDLRARQNITHIKICRKQNSMDYRLKGWAITWPTSICCAYSFWISSLPCFGWHAALFLLGYLDSHLASWSGVPSDKIWSSFRICHIGPVRLSCLCYGTFLKWDCLPVPFWRGDFSSDSSCECSHHTIQLIPI